MHVYQGQMECADFTHRSHAQIETISRRSSVTMVRWAKGCFMARYRSPAIKARWNSEATTRQDIKGKRTRSTQYPFGSSSKNITNTAMKTGWIKTPTVKSVDASKARRMFDLWALSRDFLFTAIITSEFKPAVKGNVKIWMIMKKIIAATALDEGCCNFSPNNKSTSHSEGLK